MPRLGLSRFGLMQPAYQVGLVEEHHLHPTVQALLLNSVIFGMAHTSDSVNLLNNATNILQMIYMYIPILLLRPFG